MKRIVVCFFIFVLVCFISISYAHSCDKAAAREVQTNLKAMANHSVEKGVVYYSWLDKWHEFTLPQKKGLITAAANADACLQGTARKIYFHYQGEKVAEADPTWGIKVIK